MHNCVLETYLYFNNRTNTSLRDRLQEGRRLQSTGMVDYKFSEKIVSFSQICAVPLRSSWPCDSGTSYRCIIKTFSFNWLYTWWQISQPMKCEQKRHTPLLNRGFSGLVQVLPLLFALNQESPASLWHSCPICMIPAWREEDIRSAPSKWLTVAQQYEQEINIWCKMVSSFRSSVTAP